MKIYSFMARHCFRKSFVANLLLVSFLGVHVPLIVCVLYVVLDGSTPFSAVLPLTIVLLVATVAGTVLTMGIHYALLAPVREASEALRHYLSDRTVPALPTHYEDQVGRLLADTQESITRLDIALDAERAAKVAVETDRHDRLDVISKLSHELRTPLNAIVGMSEIMQQEMLGPIGEPAYADYANDIGHSSHSLVDMVQALLDIADLEADGNADAEAFDLVQLVRSAISLKTVHATKLNVQIDFTADAERIDIVGDVRATKQIMAHLIGAALHSADPSESVVLGLGNSRDTVSLTCAIPGRSFCADDLPGTLAAKLHDRKDEYSGGAMASVSTLGLTLSLIDKMAGLVGARLRILDEWTEGRIVQIDFPTTSPRSHKAREKTASRAVDRRRPLQFAA